MSYKRDILIINYLEHQNFLHDNLYLYAYIVVNYVLFVLACLSCRSRMRDLSTVNFLHILSEKRKPHFYETSLFNLVQR